jgi:hypothetical protein
MFKLTDDAHAEMLNGLEVVFHLLYLAQIGSQAETHRCLEEMKGPLDKVAAIATGMERE